MYGNRNGNFGGGSFRPPVEVGEELDVKIEAVGEKGDGIAKKKGFVLFIPNTKEGDLVRIKVNKVLKKVAFADVIGEASGPIEEPEQKRVETSLPEPEPEKNYEDTEDFGEEAPAEETAEVSEDAPVEEAAEPEAEATEEAPAEEAAEPEAEATEEAPAEEAAEPEAEATEEAPAEEAAEPEAEATEEAPAEPAKEETSEEEKKEE